MTGIDETSYKAAMKVIREMKKKVSVPDVVDLIDSCLSQMKATHDLSNAIYECNSQYIQLRYVKIENADIQRENFLDGLNNIESDSGVKDILSNAGMTVFKGIQDAEKLNLCFWGLGFSQKIDSLTKELNSIYQSAFESRPDKYVELFMFEVAKLDPAIWTADKQRKINDIRNIEVISIESADVTLSKWRSYFVKLYVWGIKAQEVLRSMHSSIELSLKE
ncbi:MAG: hypothetical protein ABW080_06105 [Candidatus Thiodiazotropha sp.]